VGERVVDVARVLLRPRDDLLRLLDVS